MLLPFIMVKSHNRQISLVYSEKMHYFCTRKQGEMAEWSIAAVLKTVDLNGSGGSNPSLSAENKIEAEGLYFFVYIYSQ